MQHVKLMCTKLNYAYLNYTISYTAKQEKATTDAMKSTKETLPFNIMTHDKLWQLDQILGSEKLKTTKPLKFIFRYIHITGRVRTKLA